MSKCRYDLSEDCNNKDCLVCVLDKIRTEIEQNAYPIVHGVNNHELGMTLYGILQVIDKYRKGIIRRERRHREIEKWGD